MRIVALSDTHGLHRQVSVPDADAVIHCGDCCRHGNFLEFIDFLDWFESLSPRLKLLTPGNHDLCCEARLYECVAEAKARGVHLLIDEEITLDGVRFYGSPWTPLFYDWHFMKPRGEPLRKVWKNIPRRVHVLITHGPPYGHGDLAPAYGSPNPRNAGCLELLNRLKIVKPYVHVFGHIHGGYGRTNSDEFGVTTFVNASVCTEEYKPTNPCQIIDINTRA